jgi:hypothetical protein
LSETISKEKKLLGISVKRGNMGKHWEKGFLRVWPILKIAKQMSTKKMQNLPSKTYF